jgi:hypothetical protein
MRQLSAASRSFAICASSSDPATMISASMPMIRPWASVAPRRDSHRVSGHCCRSANRRTFDSFQAPIAPSSISAGDGPSSPPPASAGASSTTRCGPIVASAFIPLIHCTLTVLAMSPSSLDLPPAIVSTNEASVCHTLQQCAPQAAAGLGPRRPRRGDEHRMPTVRYDPAAIQAAEA